MILQATNMPQLKDNRKEIKLELKSIPGSEVVAKDGLLAGDIESVQGSPDDSDITRTLRVLEKIIVKWNLTDDKDQVLPINIENIRKLDFGDVTNILQKVNFTKALMDLSPMK